MHAHLFEVFRLKVGIQKSLPIRSHQYLSCYLDKGMKNYRDDDCCTYCDRAAKSYDKRMGWPSKSEGGSAKGRGSSSRTSSRFHQEKLLQSRQSGQAVIDAEVTAADAIIINAVKTVEEQLKKVNQSIHAQSLP